MLRTGAHALTTSLTCFRINLCNTVYDMDSVKRTSLYAGTKSHTSIVTRLWTAARYECHCLAVFYTGILIVLASLFTSTGTLYKSNLPNAVFSSNAHDLANLGSNRSATDRTTIDRCFSLDDGSSQTGTSGITTSTTVISRQNTNNCFFSFVYFNLELF